MLPSLDYAHLSTSHLKQLAGTAQVALVRAAARAELRERARAYVNSWRVTFGWVRLFSSVAVAVSYGKLGRRP